MVQIDYYVYRYDIYVIHDCFIAADSSCCMTIKHVLHDHETHCFIRIPTGSRCFMISAVTVLTI